MDANKKCNYGDESVISMPWYGIMHMCIDINSQVARGATCISQKLGGST